jgi:glycine cleavage system T protein
MAKQSALSTFHKSNGAQFVERDGWLLPARFGDFATEYGVVRSAAGFIDFSHRGLLQFTGPDRLSYLQGMLSNDLRSLRPGQGQYATILNQQGKVLGDLRVLCSENSFYLDLWEVLKDKVVEHLNRYLVADEVEIADRSEGYGILSIQGPDSDALLRTLLEQAALPGEPMDHVIAAVDGAKICVVRDSHTGEVGFDLIVPKSNLENVAQRLTEIGKQFSTTWVGEEAQNVLRVEAGIPRYGVDFTADNLLLEVGLDHAVSFKKGCYLGQEVIERIRSRGHVNKKLAGLLLDGPKPGRAGDPIIAVEKDVGVVTSAVFSPSLGHPIALGYIHRDFWTPGTELRIQHDTESLSATVTDLPFVPPKCAPAPCS